jgi:hypothetical protein
MLAGGALIRISHEHLRRSAKLSHSQPDISGISIGAMVETAEYSGTGSPRCA